MFEKQFYWSSVDPLFCFETHQVPMKLAAVSSIRSRTHSARRGVNSNATLKSGHKGIQTRTDNGEATTIAAHELACAYGQLPEIRNPKPAVGEPKNSATMALISASVEFNFRR